MSQADRMNITTASLLCIALFGAMIVCLDVGFRIAPSNRDNEAAQGIHGVFETAIFALLGLLLGFAFAGSMTRLEARRDLIVREANAIGTAYLRIDLIPAAYQSDMRALFHTYLEARLRVYDEADVDRDFEPALVQASQLQQQIWPKPLRRGQWKRRRSQIRFSFPL